jgi:two-component system OmpR family response regulator
MRRTAAPIALIVEDDDAIREILAVVARHVGFETATARDGFEALRYLREAEELPALVLLDLMMPGMDGLQFLDRRDGRMREVPVVVLTARPTAQVPPDVRVLRKPISMELILDAIVPYAR